ncbi:shufflon system plasmid conjugative transfer pilus tip adhesin PilV [Pseudomonas chlororaphis]|uniref:shufflon system plasmid conjugative transfer pilus tip adhesin PilV n=1 Tax=Pseudomonas chlororaphis TaxID=587753 RepID=UPI00131FAA8D|nr:pilus assembly protein PilV [Pseudomonas chlororaphis]
MKKHSNRGFVSIEIMIALIVITIAIAKGTQLYMVYLDGLNQQMAAQQQIKIAEAGSKYIKDNYAVVSATAGPTTPAVITVAMLKNTRYLPAGFSEQNIYGQDYRILARKPNANQLETLIITTGGTAAGEIDIRRVAQIIGAQGGYISTLDTSIAQGAAWQVPLGNFGVAPGPGHLATALFFQDGALVNDYLYRNAIPGKPELNEMNTALGMRGNNINNAGTINANNDINASRDLNSSRDLNTGRDINAQGDVRAANADIRGETYTQSWFRTRGDGGWYSEKWGGGFYMSDSTWVRSWMNKSIYTGGQIRGGEVQSDGRTYVGEYLQLNGLATIGTGCSPNGLLGRVASGLTLSCQDGVWKANGGATLGAAVAGGAVSYHDSSGPGSAYCPDGAVLVGLINTPSDDSYHFACRWLQ